jgi:hypothetical protein
VEVNLNIEKKDIKLVKELLKGKKDPVELEEIAYQIALHKTVDRRTHEVKIYDPDCEYKIGDYIYKEYPGKIPVGAKKYIEISHGVVLKVVNVRERFGLEEIKLSYEGTSEFKKYTNYLERQKIELLLPHKQEKPPAAPKFLTAAKDPRKKQDPLEKRDFLLLKKKLMAMLNKEQDICLCGSKILLKENIKSIDSEVFNKIKEFLTENKKSESIEFFVQHFLKTKKDEPDFTPYCFSLSYEMATNYKIDFQQTRKENWGKWNLISVIYYMKKNSPISEDNLLKNKVSFSNKKNISQRRRKFEEDLFKEGSTRFYLTQREVTCGAVRLKPGFFDLGDSIEIQILDSKNKKPHLIYNYSDENLLLGFKEIFEKYNALQGMILNFEKDEEGKLQFTIRTTKKGTIANKIDYDAEKKAFMVSEEKIASPVFVNKAMFLEPDIFDTINQRIDEFRSVETFNKLVHKIFLEFGIKEKNYEIHILRLYHILDLIFPTHLKLVEDVILNNTEFISSEKITGVFYLDSNALAKIEEEEYKRRESVKDEHKKAREEIRKKKIEEELKIKEEIRKKREERRKKREEEMWLKEKLKKEREERKLEAPKKRVAQKHERAYVTPEGKVDLTQQKPARKRAAAFGKQVDLPDVDAFPPVDRMAQKKAAPKKKKRVAEEKTLRTPKKTEAKVIDDKLSEEEIKSQIQLEELKEKMKEKKDREKQLEKEKKIAYEDSGTVGSIFASKLDSVVKKEDKPKKKKTKQK